MDVYAENPSIAREKTRSWSAVASSMAQHETGVLLLVPERSQINVTRIQGAMELWQDQQTSSLIEACRLLLTQRFTMVIVLPGALAPTDEASLAVLRRVADEVPVLVLGEGAAPLALPVTCAEPVAATSVLPNSPLAEPVPSPTVAVGPITGYRASGMIAVGGKPLKLSGTLARILWRLMEAPQNRCAIADLIEEMPNPGLNKSPATLRVHIHRLRSRLEAHGASGILHGGSGTYWLHWPATVTRPAAYLGPFVRKCIKSRSTVDRNGLPG